ncbi:kelch domain-containing protein 7A [Periophthalmus magnuspinnatus]|uniref:kelch domain-containing protein 7A n=1 Tax=Periophthalmus magnuspinnatus TaxID=409849 RepID=UPI00145BCF76|nr:kelch domain-containing protein 7A [Periophthalmus magnuspinnatus]
MPIADLLGVQLDMQFLWRLSLSAAVVLLVSWAYKFYSSRDRRTRGLCGNKNGSCQNCSAMLDLTKNESEDVDKEILNLHRQSAVSTSNISFGTSLKHSHPAEKGMANATGRVSPCFLQRLEGSVGVGRELRQDLERQGAHCSFLSKAEIKVEDANVLAEGTGDQIVRGKIYDYYVESSSRSITELGETKSVAEIVRHGNGESLSSMNTIILRDLVLTQSNDQNSYTPLGKLKQRPPARPTLQRNQSYQSAAEESEFAIPPLTSRGATPATYSPTSPSVHCKICPSIENVNVEESEPDAKPLFLQLQLSDCTDLESVKSRINLGNCLEILQLAKREEHTLLQQAALCVMSDNYLQVLRDPNLYGRLLAGEREQIRKLRMKGRVYVMVADMDPQDWVQDTEEIQPSSAIYYYDDYKDNWQKLCQIPPEVISKACSMCTLDNYLYVALGCQCTGREVTPSKRVFCYNPLTSIWREISPMNQARPRCKLAALDGCIYAIGGECLSSVERYDPRLNRWAFVAPLPNDTFAVAHHVAVCDGEIFVSGGTLRCMLLRYNPQVNSWRVSLLGSKDRTADMVAVGRFLYRFDVNPLLGLSVYRYHSFARLWYECSSKRILRCPAFQCVVMYGNIYCVNRQFTLKFDADEVFPAFADEELSVLPAAKGMLFPFVLSLPDKNPRQTSV